MNVWIKLKRLCLMKYLNILSLNISVPWKVLPAYILLSNALVILYIACYKAMLKKASISRHQLGKYTQREKEKNFYLDQSRKQDIEYPWKKSITAQLFYAFCTLTAICSISQAILRSYLLILYIALHDSHKNMFRLCLASDQCLFLTLCIEAFLSLTSLSKSNER